MLSRRVTEEEFQLVSGPHRRDTSRDSLAVTQVASGEHQCDTSYQALGVGEQGDIQEGKVWGLMIDHNGQDADKQTPFLQIEHSPNDCPKMWLFLLIGLAAAFNNPPGVDIWCGKAYRST